MKHRIAFVGFGTVGQGLAQILLQKKEELNERYQFDYDIVAVSTNSHGTVYNPDGLNIQTLLEDAAAKRKFSIDTREWNALQMIKESNATIVCEMAVTNLEDGEPAISHCKAALTSGKHVVTCNKGPAALAYAELTALAKAHNLQFLIEGTVMSGTPVLNLADGPLAGCRIDGIRGILNGTTNYILTQMEEGMSYEEALLKAQELGYAETDPTGDVEGFDARGKVAILANVVMGTSIGISDISCRGIGHLTSKDIAEAKEQNCRWKLIGSIKKEDQQTIVASVAPEMLPLSHPLAGVMGATNALTFTTDLLGDVSIVGPGAGKVETGYSLLTDLLKIDR